MFCGECSNKSLVYDNLEAGVYRLNEKSMCGSSFIKEVISNRFR